jgi:crotonobetainyl-CoA:carnitine CoA-transferase CaiB-like acyl-CoA transferase
VSTYDGLLSGVRVLDLSIWRPGPYATQLLADLGADVLKVEPPDGDPMRMFPDLFATLNANKRSVVLDLKTDDGRARVHELVADADALVEGFRPGVVDRLGVDYETVRAINPALVYCSISGFGQTGPLAHAPGHDLNYQAVAAALAPQGGEPIWSPIPIGDLAGGVFGALGVVAAIVGRARTGLGEHVDVSMTDVLATWTGPLEGTVLADEDQALGGLPTYGCFPTKDGRFLTLGLMSEEHLWVKMCDALGLEHLRDLDMRGRIARGDEIRGAIAEVIAAHPLDELVRMLDGTPVAPSLTRAEMLEHPQLAHRGLVGLTTADGSPVMGYPVLFGSRPARPPGHPPALGEHQDEGFAPRG